MTDPRALGAIEPYLASALERVYGELLTESVEMRLPVFQETQTDAASLARSVIGYRDACAAGLLSVWRGASELVVSASLALHRQLCIPGRATNGYESSACRREVALSGYLLQLFAKLCDHWFDSAVDDALLEPMLATHASQAEVADAVEANLRIFLHPPWQGRELLPISERKPTVHIASPITVIDVDAYVETRHLTQQLRRELEAGGYLVETPSDFISPENRDRVPTDEMLTLTALHRASLMVLFADGGGHGTATTWTIAAELGIPTLVLHSPGTDLRALRFAGKFFRRAVVCVTTADEAVLAVAEFVAENAGRARRRARRLAAFRDIDITHLERALRSVDPIAFDGSTVTWEAARMYVTDPVNWFQARPEVAKEVTRVLGTPALSAVADVKGIDHVAGPIPEGNGLFGLLTLAEEKGWPPEVVVEAWDVFRNVVEVGEVSARPVTVMNYDAWIALLTQKGWTL